MFRYEHLRHFAEVGGGSYEMISVFLFCEFSTKKAQKGTIKSFIKYMKFKPLNLFAKSTDLDFP